MYIDIDQIVIVFIYPTVSAGTFLQEPRGVRKNCEINLPKYVNTRIFANVLADLFQALYVVLLRYCVANGLTPISEKHRCFSKPNISITYHSTEHPLFRRD